MSKQSEKNQFLFPQTVGPAAANQLLRGASLVQLVRTEAVAVPFISIDSVEETATLITQPCHQPQARSGPATKPRRLLLARRRRSRNRRHTPATHSTAAKCVKPSSPITLIANLAR